MYGIAHHVYVCACKAPSEFQCVGVVRDAIMGAHDMHVSVGYGLLIYTRVDDPTTGHSLPVINARSRHSA